MSFLFAAFALIGGGLGARIAHARLSAGVYAAGVGFIASVAAQLNGATEPLTFLFFLVGAIVTGRLFKLRPLQIAIVIVSIIVASLVGGFLVGFFKGFDDAFLKALNHSSKL